MNKLFGDLKMKWLTVILFAVVAGVYTGLVMSFDVLKETSVQDIGMTYEWWVIFAIIIVVNCQKNWEAMLKCFVFFLISQPVVFLTEILLGHVTMYMGLYYYRQIWLPMTFLTLPGGLIAYYCKKQNLVGAIILALGNLIQVVMGCSYAIKAISDFPHHIVTVVVCFASVFVMSFCIQKKKKYRMISIVVPFVLMVLVGVLLAATGRVLA